MKNKQSPQELCAYLQQYLELFEQGKSLATAPVEPAAAWQPPAGGGGRRVVICAPHPDDEVLGGLLPLRLLHDDHELEVVNLAMTLGSDRARQQTRLDEMRTACAMLGFSWLLPAEPGGFALSAAAASDKAGWESKVRQLAGHFQALNPALVVCPHSQDRHPTHELSNRLVREALLRHAAGHEQPPLLLETEFWQPMADANLLLGGGVREVAQLMAALLAHRGELARNPYHCFLPAWLMDNVRRGGELVQGFGSKAPDFVFGVLGKLSKVSDTGLQPARQAMVVGPQEVISLEMLKRLAG